VRQVAMVGKLTWNVGPETGSEIKGLRLAWTDYIPLSPTPKQLAFLLCPSLEAFYGGAAGGGKSLSLLMAALQYVDTPGYAALIIRKTFVDLSLPNALLDVAQSWLANTDARWRDIEKTWHFPSGATLTFGYLDHPKDKYRYQSSAFQYCVAKGTPVLMADYSWRAIEDIGIGDYVQTLEGPQQILKVHRLGRKPVSLLSSVLGEALVSAEHRVLSAFDGWATPRELLSRLCLPFGNSNEYSAPMYAESSLHLGCSPPGPPQDRERYRQSGGEMAVQGYVASSEGDHSDYAESVGGCQAPWRLGQPHAILALYGQSPQLKGRLAALYASFGAWSGSSPVGSPIDYLMDRHSCDAPALIDQATGLNGIQQRGDVAGRIPVYQHLDDLGYIHGCSPRWYAHPYTMESRPIYGGVLGLPCRISPTGEEEVLDLTVSSCSHYIIYPGLVSSNCGFDEATQFPESDYTYLFSRLRRLKGVDIPIRMRAASNPGNIGHDWVKERFLSSSHPDRVFIPARLADNPYLDADEYRRSLAELDPITRRQIEEGDWSARHGGNMFRREWFEIVDAAPAEVTCVRFWDLAGTEAKEGKDPDWTVGLLLGKTAQNVLYVLDVRRLRGTANTVETLVKQTAELDGRNIPVRMEQEPGSSGAAVIDHYRRSCLMGYDFKGVPATGSKSVRASPVASQAEAGNIKLVRAPWNRAFLDEFELFPLGSHDDEVDALSGALQTLTTPTKRFMVG